MRLGAGQVAGREERRTAHAEDHRPRVRAAGAAWTSLRSVSGESSAREWGSALPGGRGSTTGFLGGRAGRSLLEDVAGEVGLHAAEALR
ncbi:MAG TPA: hypothetical protein VMU15_21870, partial [Anaeromyxobacter sp.]|nr:hypothetical protein [Anaeromyxobacter sp.]